MFFCPGCQKPHLVTVGEGPGPRWGYNGNSDAPTFTPSVLVRSGHFAEGRAAADGECWCNYTERTGDTSPFTCGVCHSFVTDGQIQFLGDCTHSLAGQTVPLPPFDGEG